MSEELNRLNEISGFFRRMNTKVKLLTLITKAKEEYDRYDYKSGIETLEEAFKIDPQNPTVLRGLGCMKQFSGDYDTAIEFYRKALEFSEAQEVETKQLKILTLQLIKMIITHRLTKDEIKLCLKTMSKFWIYKSL